MRVLIPAFGILLALAATGCRTETQSHDANPDSRTARDTSGHQAGSDSTSTDEETIVPSAIEFKECSDVLGFSFRYHSGADARLYSMLEFAGGGVGVLDFDADGFPDLFLPGGGTFKDDYIVGKPGALFRNEMGVKFAAAGELAGGGFPSRFYSHGVSVGDVNSDGFPDFVVTGYGGISLWLNRGDGTFAELGKRFELVDQLWSTSAGWGDFDRDGILDLYVAHYLDWSLENNRQCFSEKSGERDLCPPRAYAPLEDMVFLANGDGTFRNGNVELKLRKDGKGLGVLIADLDLNGHTDIYVANDTTDNFLYLNMGEMSLSECGMINGAAVDKLGIPNGSMGVSLLDFDENELPDIWVTNFENESFALYRNEGDGIFLDVGANMGIQSLGQKNVGFGTIVEDFDLDGDEDIFVTNGHTYLVEDNAPRKQLPLFLEHRNGRFQRVHFGPESYMSQAWLGRGLAHFDFDRDGDTDLIVTHLEEPASILRNETEKMRNWVRLRLIGRQSNRDAVGATAVLTVGERRLSRQRIGGGSYLSSGQAELCWGLDKTSNAGPLQVRWPSGKVTSLQQVAINQLTTIVEPR